MTHGASGGSGAGGGVAIPDPDWPGFGAHGAGKPIRAGRKPSWVDSKRLDMGPQGLETGRQRSPRRILPPPGEISFSPPMERRAEPPTSPKSLRQATGKPKTLKNGREVLIFRTLRSKTRRVFKISGVLGPAKSQRRKLASISLEASQHFFS